MAQGLHLPKGLLGFQAEVKFLQGSDMAGLWERSPLAWELTRREPSEQDPAQGSKLGYRDYEGQA